MATATEEADEGPGYDPRTPEQIRYDAIGDQLRDTTLLVRDMADAINEFISNNRNNVGNVQTVIHKTEGMGIVGGICASICVLCVIFLIIVVVFVDGKLSAIEAWQGVFGRDLTALHTKIDQPKEKAH